MAEHEVSPQEVQVPPDFNRDQEERDQWIQNALHRVRERIEGNGRRIEGLGEDMGQRFGDIARRIGELNRWIDGLREDVDLRFGDDIARRFGGTERKDMDRRFARLSVWIKFTSSIVAAGIVAILVKLFVG